MTFRVGQKVVCVYDKNYLVDPMLRAHPHKGEVVTIAGIKPNGTVYIDGCGVGERYPAFFPHRFRPVIERKTDISIFKKMLRPVSKELCGND
jgi:hypothetical protein